MIAEFDSANEMWLAMIKDCLRSGRRLDSREKWCTEVVGWSGRLTNLQRSLVNHPHRKISASYCGAEVLWYLSLTGDIKMINEYAPSYEKLWADDAQRVKSWSNDESRYESYREMYGAVGGRLNFNPGFRDAVQFVQDTQGKLRDLPENQLDACFRLLQKKPNTRQAVIALWDSGDLAHSILGDKRNVPCYTTFQFFVRSGELHMAASMRSNDVWLGAPYDIFAFTCIQRLMADCLGLRLGSYTHTVGSLHIYDKHLDRCKKATELRAWENALQEHNWKRIKSAKGKLPTKAAEGAIELERHFREDADSILAAALAADCDGAKPSTIQNCVSRVAFNCPNDWLHDLARAALSKLYPQPLVVSHNKTVGRAYFIHGDLFGEVLKKEMSDLRL